ncbi:MAG: hypothetical protein PHI39_00040 [Kiritimatiellae bacterium]|nr:hypothetical protein [Kiritimatiellia bacterium]
MSTNRGHPKGRGLQIDLCRKFIDGQRHLVGSHIQSVLDLADFDIVLGSLHTGP